MSPRRRLALLAAGAMGIAGAAAYRLAPARSEPPLAARPPGWWSLDVDGMAPEALTADEAARTLSLPYASAGTRREAPGGVRRFDAARAWPGHNLYVSAHAPEAVLIDLAGRPLWRWRLPFERAFPGKPPSVETDFWRRVRPLPGGDLLVLIQGGGVFRLDRHSRLRWRSAVSAYNDLVPTADGGVFTLVKEARQVPPLAARGTVLEDFLVELDEHGRVRRKTSILAALLASPWADWVRAHPAGDRDLLHSNTIVPLDGSLADLHPAFAAGNVLLSLREIDALVVLDPASGELRWALRGRWQRQHQPTLLPGGELALFDNRGAAGGASRLLVMDPRDAAIRREYPPAGERPLRSAQAGSLQLLPNGNLLVVESQGGRALEVTSTDEVVWEWWSPHRAGERNQMVAYLFDVLRVPADWLPADGMEAAR